MSPPRPVDEQAADWIALRDGQQWSDDRQRELDRWLSESTLHRVAYLRLQHAWQRADRLQAARAPALPRPRRFGGRAWTAWLAPWPPRIAAAAIVAALVWFPWPIGEEQVTDVGERKTLSLADGSRLTLNTATRLRTDVDARERRVWLDQGEAYFEVEHDALHPFEVWSGSQRVVVLGTRFLVRRTGDRLQVSVFEGRVKIVAAAETTPVFLSAGEAALSAGSVLEVKQQTPQELSAALGWLDGKLVFDNVSLADAALQFNRYNRKQLRLGDAKAAQLMIGGTFGATNVEAFARLLHTGFGLEVVGTSDSITLRSAPP